MGQQNSSKTIIGLHTTMHVMHPIKVLQLLLLHALYMVGYSPSLEVDNVLYIHVIIHIMHVARTYAQEPQ